MQITSPANRFLMRLYLDQYGTYSAIRAASPETTYDGTIILPPLSDDRYSIYEDWCLKNWNELWKNEKNFFKEKYKEWRKRYKPTLFQRLHSLIKYPI